MRDKKLIALASKFGLTVKRHEVLKDLWWVARPVGNTAYEIRVLDKGTLTMELKHKKGYFKAIIRNTCASAIEKYIDEFLQENKNERA